MRYAANIIGLLFRRTPPAFAILIAVGCASIKPPPGGDKDAEGPKLLRVEPPNGELYFDKKDVAFYFDEYINPGSYSQEIFISPVPQKEPLVYAVGKRLMLKLRDTLAPNTTYVVTLGEGIKDFNERNSLNGSIQYAFSTGSVLDTGVVAGRVKDAYNGGGKKEFTVMLFSPDSVENYDFRNKRPIYAAQTDASGNFKLNYIKFGRYRIFAVGEKDRTYRYDQPTESVAIALADTVSLDSSKFSFEKNLSAFAPDTFPPKLAKVEYLNPRNLILTFSEAVTEMRVNDSLFVDKKESDAKTLLYWIPQALPDTFNVDIEAISDTAANRSDTLLDVRPFQGKDTTRLIFSEAPDPLRPRLWRTKLNDPLFSTDLNKFIYLQDTGKRRFTPSIKTRGYFLELTPPAKLDSTINYEVVIDSTLRSASGYRPDSTLRFSWRPKTVESLGTLRGKIVSDKTKLKLWLISPDNKTKFEINSDFYIDNMPPGSYRYAILEDDDNNGRWTPGSLTPFRPPETLFFYPQPVVIRAGWDVEDFKVEYPFKETPKTSKKP